MSAPTSPRWHAPGILLADTITKLPPEADGAVVVSGSHGGLYPGFLAAQAGARAVIFNDAGIGRDEAGIGSLAYLAALGIAAATMSHLSCRIGDTDDMLAHGRISRANASAQALGVADGMACPDAAQRLTGAPHHRVVPPPIGETRSEITVPHGRRRIWLIDSASLVRPDDADQIVVTGSHGGLIGGNPALALRTEAWAAVFNDAGRVDGPGTTRLPALAERGIAALTVATASARIGDGRSTFQDGVISAANKVALARGACLGEAVAERLGAWAAES